MFQSSKLWKKAFPEADSKNDNPVIDGLVSGLLAIREKAMILVGEIPQDLSGYTVHDISHLDALWEVASQITGDTFEINPVEGFVLGGAFLLHDSAMCLAAYSGGLDEIKETIAWRKIVARLTTQDQSHADFDTNSVVEIFLREQHAIRAEELPFVTWDSPQGSRALIEDVNMRTKFGTFIGKVAASHWWGHDKLEEEFKDHIIPALSPYSSDWSIDMPKLACVLRTADAAQIDDRRAPGFLMALRQNKLTNLSRDHWMFQGRLTQPQCRSDSLCFASATAFDRSEANSWWLLHDTFKMIDRELKKTDDLLYRSRGDQYRFAARKIANIESPITLKTSVPTKNWKPVDTSLSISDIPRVVQNLGGSQL